MDADDLQIVEFMLFLLFYFSITYLCFVNSIISFIVFFEVSSMVSYVLISLNKGLLSTSAVKYLIYGILCSSIMLFGFSLLWCITGLTSFSEINTYIYNISGENFSDYYLIIIS